MSTELEFYFSEENLLLAFERIKRATDRDTKNHLAIEIFQADLKHSIAELHERLINDNYVPTRPFKFLVPKPAYTQRAKTILQIDDAIVYQAIANIIAFNHYDELTNHKEYVLGSVLAKEVKYGTTILDDQEANLFFFENWKPLYEKFKTSVERAVKIDKLKYKLITDITGFFDSIPHSNFLLLLENKYSVPEPILLLLEKCLNTWSGTAENMTIGIGIPQGPQASFFFANIILHDLDNYFALNGITYLRYMDDIRIYSFDKPTAITSLIEIDIYVKRYALALNMKKTSIEPVINDDTDDSLINFFNYEFEVFSSQESNSFEDIEEFNDKTLINDNVNIENEFNSMADQDNKTEINISQSEKYNVDLEALKKYWINNLIVISVFIEEWFESDDEGQIKLLPENDIKDFDRKAMEYAFEFINAYKRVIALGGEYEQELRTANYWIYFIKKYFWRANYFLEALECYKYNEYVKKNLLSLAEEFYNYEWIRSKIYSTLILTQTFTPEELFNLQQKVINENSIYVKISIYKLLLYHQHNPNILKGIFKLIKTEKDYYLKTQIFYFYMRRAKKILTIDEIKEAF